MPHNELVYPWNVCCVPAVTLHCHYPPVPQHEDSILTLCTSFIIGKNQKFLVVGLGRVFFFLIEIKSNSLQSHSCGSLSTGVSNLKSAGKRSGARG